jgi:hypothetical protein
MPNSGRRYQSQTSSEDYLEEEYVFPPNGWIYSIIIGIVGGIIALAVPVIIALANASLFNAGASAASKAGEGIPDQLASSLFALQCVSTLIDLAIAFVVGMVARRIVVKWWLSLVAGAVTGAFVNLGLFLTHYIPGYPGVITTTSATGTWIEHFLGFIIPILLYAVVGGVTSLAGAYITPSKHPYYR